MGTLIKPSNYVAIFGWMPLELGLKGNDLLIYAIIYGFSQTERNAYRGSNKYFQEWTGATEKTVIESLKGLRKRGLIKRVKQEFFGITFKEYVALCVEGKGYDKALGRADIIEDEEALKWLNEERNLTEKITGLAVKSKVSTVKSKVSPVKNNPNNNIIIYNNTKYNIIPDSDSPNGEASEPTAPNTQGLEGSLPHEMLNNSSIPPTPLPSLDAFEECWIAYGRKGSKKKALEQWKKLSLKDADKVPLHIPHYIKDREMIYRKDFERYLRDKIFLDIVYGKNGECYDPSETKVEEPTKPKSKWQ